MRGWAVGIVLAVGAGPAVAQAPSAAATPGGVAYEREGDGPVVVFVHAFSLDRRMWNTQTARLRDRYTVVRFDQRAHGATPAATEPYAPYEDLVAVLDAVGAERAVVVGLSSGSGIAVDAALADPERIAGLVLAAPTVGGYRPTGSFAWMAPVVEAAQAGDEVTAAERFADTELMQVHARVAVAVRDMIVDNAGLWSLRQNPAVPLEPPAIERLDGIAIPVLVVVGGADTEDTKAVAAVLSQGIRDVRVEELPGAGHLVNFTAPDRFDRLLERFLAEVWP